MLIKQIEIKDSLVDLPIFITWSEVNAYVFIYYWHTDPLNPKNQGWKNIVALYLNLDIVTVNKQFLENIARCFITLPSTVYLLDVDTRNDNVFPKDLTKLEQLDLKDGFIEIERK